ncbi:hypothetical protein [Macrococcoides canis]|uniref:hypothetical protein n=1 Tax=Macrococcoides canis TaxID=1855823 RepID=UPI00105C84C0|nr:hypothetical protein [Macrococcus canis]TDM24330.1 hypothetical protein ETI02_00610 [Macrococcus canis]
MLECIERLVNIIDLHPWIANLIGILLSALVAIGVMKKNHQDADIRDDKRKKDNDNIEIRKAQFRILDAIRTCHVYYATFTFDYNDNENDVLDFKHIENIKNIVDDMNDSLKLNKEVAIHDIDMYIKLTETTTKMLDDIAVIQRLLNSKTLWKNAGIIESLKSINNKGYEYLKNNSVFDFNQDLKV